jgi:hypothetical protein
MEGSSIFSAEKSGEVMTQAFKKLKVVGEEEAVCSPLLIGRAFSDSY